MKLSKKCGGGVRVPRRLRSRRERTGEGRLGAAEEWETGLAPELSSAGRGEPPASPVCSPARARFLLSRSTARPRGPGQGEGRGASVGQRGMLSGPSSGPQLCRKVTLKSQRLEILKLKRVCAFSHCNTRLGSAWPGTGEGSGNGPWYSVQGSVGQAWVTSHRG